MIKHLIKVLLSYKYQKYKKIDGWLSENEAFGLFYISFRLPFRSNVVEIGSWQGKSTYCILSGLKSGKVYAIDPFNAAGGSDLKSETEYFEKAKNIDLLEKFKININKFLKKKKVEIRKGYSNQFHKEFSQINFLFIDGDHSINGCKEDYNLYAPQIVKGGYIAFHDYDSGNPTLGPTYVVDEIILKENKFTFYKKYDSLWIGRKN